MFEQQICEHNPSNHKIEYDTAYHKTFRAFLEKNIKHSICIKTKRNYIPPRHPKHTDQHGLSRITAKEHGYTNEIYDVEI